MRRNGKTNIVVRRRDVGIAPYEKMQQSSVGADAHIGPDNRRSMSLSVGISGSGAGAETILLPNRKRKSCVNVR